MRGVLLGLALMVFASPCLAAELVGNTTLLEKLKEKGILSEDEVKDIEKDRPRVKLGGRLQVQYENTDADAENSKKSEFFVRRARLKVEAELTPWGYMVLQPTADKGSFTLKDAYIGITPGPVKIFVGNHYVPFSRELLTSSTKLNFVERNLVSQFGPDRQMGLSVLGNGMDKKIEWQAGFFNGSLNTSALDVATLKASKNTIYHGDFSNSGDNNKLMYGGRLEFHPFGYLKRDFENFKREEKAAFGVSYYASDDSPNAGATADTVKGSNALEVDVDVRWAGLTAYAEYSARNIDFYDSSAATQSANQKGYSVEASYLLTQKLALAARYDYLDYDDTDSGLKGSKGQLEDTWTTVGFSYYFSGHNLKIQANYVSKDEKMPSGAAKPKNNSILVQTAYSF